MTDGPIALVPLRIGGKSRLAGALDDATRRHLVLAMLDDVVAALRAGGIADVRVLAGDDGAEDAAMARGLPALRDPSPDGDLRAAVDAGLAAVGDGTVRLVVAADLPGLTAADVAGLLADADRVTVLPTPDGGTAVLVLPAGVTVAAAYGPGSAVGHVAAARAVGAEPVLLAVTAAGRDLDGPGDLDAAHGAPVGPATTATLHAVAPHRRT